ncbi:hypothetical protein AURDEDRAFT_174147 [Auricularia subglabra TFB-10046 SS5]|nr:hypothetical protein AURDEDRAFT_174147 [Auricularia subglabra TFB-10046 SS5]
MFSLVAAQGTPERLAASCYVTCLEDTVPNVSSLCNVPDGDLDASRKCFCTNDTLQDEFGVCLDKTCSDRKDAAQTISDTMCRADAKTLSDSVDCIRTCGDTTGVETNTTCPDIETQEDCSCRSDSLRSSLKNCLATMCPKFSDTAMTYAGVLCAADDFRVNNATGTPTGGDGPSTTENSGSEGGNSATAPIRSGAASTIVLAAALISALM